MYPTLPFGPLSLPTAPLLALLAVVLTLDIGGRFARRVKIQPDDLWNTGLVAIATGLVVARLWNVFQFWSIYRATPLLIISIRPSGFVLWPGVVAALFAGYAYLLYRALDPRRVAAAMSVGLLAGTAVLAVSGYMTGAILGLPSSVPWALTYFGELRHPVGLYRAIGLLFACMLVWIGAEMARPGRIIWQSLFAYSLVRFITDGYLDGTTHIAGVRTSQLIALGVALLSAGVLASTARNSIETTPTDGSEPLSVSPDDESSNTLQSDSGGST